MTEEEKINQISAYKAMQRQLRQITEGVCNSAQTLELLWIEFDSEIVAGGLYEAAILAHAESVNKVPGTAQAIDGLRAALARAVQIAQAMQMSDSSIFPGLNMPSEA